MCVALVGMLTHLCAARTGLGVLVIGELLATTRDRDRRLSLKARSVLPHHLDQLVATDVSDRLMATLAVCEKILGWIHLRLFLQGTQLRREVAHPLAAVVPPLADDRLVASAAASVGAPMARSSVGRVNSPKMRTRGVRGPTQQVCRPFSATLAWVVVVVVHTQQPTFALREFVRWSAVWQSTHFDDRVATWLEASEGSSALRWRPSTCPSPSSSNTTSTSFADQCSHGSNAVGCCGCRSLTQTHSELPVPRWSSSRANVSLPCCAARVRNTSN